MTRTLASTDEGRAPAPRREREERAPAPAATESPRAWNLGLALLLLLAAVLRFAPLEHGMPRNYVPDTNVVRAALGMAKDKDLVPPAGKYSQYPNLLPYLLLPAYAVQYAAGKAGGDWRDAQGYGRAVLEHPEDAQRIARWLVALFGAATAWVVFRAARAAGLARGAWVAAWLVATGLLHTHFSVQERPWVPMTFFFALCAWPAARYARSGRARDLVLAGVAAGLAFACHQGGLGALAIAGLAWLFGPLRWRGADLRARLAQGVACVLVFAAIALLLGHAHYLRYGRTPDAAVIGGGEEIRERGGVAIGGMSLLFGVRWDSIERLSKCLVGYDPVVLLLGIAGLGIALRRRELRAAALWTILWAAFFLTNQSDHVRYLLPVTVLLALPAGLAVERFGGSRAARVVLAVLLAFPLVQALRLDLVLMREDTRAEAEHRLASTQRGARLAIDRYGPEVDLDLASLERLAGLRAAQGETLRARESHRQALLESAIEAPGGPGVDAVRVEDVLEVDTRARTVAVREKLAAALGTDPLAALRALGVTHLLRVDRRPRSSAEDLLLPLCAEGLPSWTIDPSRGDAETAEAFLPTEMDFPLTGLWTVDRPGPRLSLHALR